jgi:hypothetical protein
MRLAEAVFSPSITKLATEVHQDRPASDHSHIDLALFGCHSAILPLADQLRLNCLLGAGFAQLNCLLGAGFAQLNCVLGAGVRDSPARSAASTLRAAGGCGLHAGKPE